MSKKVKQKLALRLVAGAAVTTTIAFPSALYGQEIGAQSEQGKLVREVILSEEVKLSIMERDPAENSKAVKAPVEMTEAMMVKQILGEIYMEVGHVPEIQWNSDLVPIAEHFVNILFDSRKMQDREAATRRVQEARAKYEADIKSKLTQDQLNTWQQRQAEDKARMQRYEQQLLLVKDAMIQAIESDNNLSNKTIIIDVK